MPMSSDLQSEQYHLEPRPSQSNEEDDGPELQVHGSSNLIQTLLRQGLVDEFRVWIFPVVLGSGKRLFGDGTLPAGLELVDSKTSTTGVIFATYAPAGEIHQAILRAEAVPALV